MWTIISLILLIIGVVARPFIEMEKRDTLHKQPDIEREI